MKLDTESSVPLYKQLMDIIKRDISNGIYKHGQKIPSEVEFQESYNISRITIRKALQELTDEKILERRRGKGTYVADVKLERSISTLMSFTEVCEAQNLKPGGRIIKCILEEPTETDRQEMGLKEGEKMVTIERVRYADSVPVSVEMSQFTEKYSFLLGENLNDCSLFELLEKKYGIKFQNYVAVLELVFADKEMSCYLDVPVKCPLLLVTSSNYDQDGAFAFRCQQYIVGTRFKFMV